MTKVDWETVGLVAHCLRGRMAVRSDVCVCVGGALTEMGRQEGDNSFTLRRFTFSAWGSLSVPEFGCARQ